MNITWGFIIASQQSPQKKIMKAKSKGVGGAAGASPLLTQHLPARDEGFLIAPLLWPGSPLLSPPLLLSYPPLLSSVAGEARGGRRAPPKSLHLQHK